MFKKLAKYGNSTALVIDKAILELLGMSEGSTVKLHTDGKSLMITPVEVEQAPDKISYAGNEAFVRAMEVVKDDSKGVLQKSHEEWAKYPEEVKAQAIKEYREISDRYGNPMMKFMMETQNSPEFQMAVTKIAEQYDPVVNNKEYWEAYAKLRNQFSPELEKMDQEMLAVNKKYGIK